MPTYLVRLKKREEIAAGTMAFHFEKPPQFEFQAGQFITLTLINPPETDVEGDTRAFSLASAPYEKDLMIATRMRESALKRILKTTAFGASVEIRGPFGSLVLHRDVKRPAVFVAGGIGITPFRSIVLQATHDRLPHRLVLFYSNRRPEDAAFLAELEVVDKVNPNYTFIGTMTEMAKSSRRWEGQKGHISNEMLSNFIKDLAEPVYYIAGPPAMVESIGKLLEDSGADKDNIRIEKFVGYS